MKKLSLSILIIANVAAVLGLWATGWCGYMNPNTYGWLSLMGYAFPAFILATVAFLFVWVVVKKRFLLISFIGLIAAYQPVTLYSPLNSMTAADHLPDSLITLLSYNTCGWGNMPTSPNKTISKDECHDVITAFIKGYDADIVALQEANIIESMKKLYDYYEYSDTIKGKNDKAVSLTLLSHYPIKKKQNLYIDSPANAAGAFWLDVKGREVIVLNIHLESMHFTISERDDFREMVHGKRNESDSIRSTSHTIVGKIYSATKRRANQAETIAGFIAAHSATPIIVMGDFNDIPQSYVYYTISGGLIDCYATTGFGPGYTFSQYGMRARIDNILCTPHFHPYNCQIIGKDIINLSDHQPITCKLRLF